MYWFAVLGSTSIVIHRVKQRLHRTGPGSGTRDFSRLLARKITKGIHSCIPASLNCPIGPMLHTQRLHNTYAKMSKWMIQSPCYTHRNCTIQRERETERERETTQYTRKEDDQVDGTGTMLHTQKLHTKKKLCWWMGWWWGGWRDPLDTTWRTWGIGERGVGITGRCLTWRGSRFLFPTLCCALFFSAADKTWTERLVSRDEG